MGSIGTWLLFVPNGLFWPQNPGTLRINTEKAKGSIWTDLGDRKTKIQEFHHGNIPGHLHTHLQLTWCRGVSGPLGITTCLAGAGPPSDGPSSS